MQFIGPPFTFGITQLSSQTTIMGSNAAVAVGDSVFWMGEDRFYAYDGRVQPCLVPCEITSLMTLTFNKQTKCLLVLTRPLVKCFGSTRLRQARQKMTDTLSTTMSKRFGMWQSGAYSVA